MAGAGPNPLWRGCLGLFLFLLLHNGGCWIEPCPVWPIGRITPQGQRNGGEDGGGTIGPRLDRLSESHAPASRLGRRSQAERGNEREMVKRPCDFYLYFWGLFGSEPARGRFCFSRSSNDSYFTYPTLVLSSLLPQVGQRPSHLPALQNTVLHFLHSYTSILPKKYLIPPHLGHLSNSVAIFISCV